MVKTLPANAVEVRDAGSIPGSGRSPGRGHSNPLQYSCLGNPMDRGAWWATVHGLQSVSTTERLTTTSTWASGFLCDRHIGGAGGTEPSGLRSTDRLAFFPLFHPFFDNFLNFIFDIFNCFPYSSLLAVVIPKYI